MVLTINIKKDFPNSSYAVFLVDREIELAPKLNTNVLIVIHGYGSHGVGGVIKKELHIFLEKQKRLRKILDYVPGENFVEQNLIVKELNNNYPELILNSNLQNCNSGVTVVWIKK